MHSQTIQAIGAEYATRRKYCKKVKLAWRKSGCTRHSLEWNSFKAPGIAYAYCQIRYGKAWLSLLYSYGRKNCHLGRGSMSEDARGCWYINICATPKHKPMRQRALLNESVGIDLGLREYATTSDGAIVEAQPFYRALEETRAIAKHSYKKGRSRRSMQRSLTPKKFFQHKLGTRLVQAYGANFVGNVKPHPLRKRPKPNRFWTRARVHSGPCCSSNAVSPAYGLRKLMMCIPHRPVAAAKSALVQKGREICE